jgi:hypothetical protein
VPAPVPVLVRPVSTSLLQQLQAARGLAVCPSPAVKRLAAQVAEAAAAELSAGARLRELLAVSNLPSTQEGVAALEAAIAAAEPFASLAADVAAVRLLHQQSCTKAEVAAELQAVVEQVVAATRSTRAAAAGINGSSSGSDGGSSSTSEQALTDFSAAAWQEHISRLETAAGAARDANVAVTKVGLVRVHAACVLLASSAASNTSHLPCTPRATASATLRRASSSRSCRPSWQQRTPSMRSQPSWRAAPAAAPSSRRPSPRQTRRQRP